MTTVLRIRHLLHTGTRLACLLACLALCAPLAAQTQEEPCRNAGNDIPAIAFREVVRGLDAPLGIYAVPDGSGRLFVLEQRGTIRIIEQGKLVTQPFLDLREVVASGGEKGLLGLAFHPRYRENGIFFVDYTTERGGLHTIIARFKRADANRAARDSEVVLLRIKQPYANHNGGQLAFGPDGYLYIGMGDGGAANDPHGNGQKLDTLLGKLLRLDIDKKEDSGRHYAIPRDNPFVGRNDARLEIYAVGLRNPWRLSFDALTHTLYVADVGQDRVEEIDVVTKGGNYGWNIMEGDICTPAVNKNCEHRGLILPIATYRHPEGFSITGGFVYRGRAIPTLCGTYLYADYVTRRMWGLRYDGKRVTAQREWPKTRYAISTFGEDAQHELYIADHSGGAILKIVPAP